jgi:hypothetical protein
MPQKQFKQEVEKELTGRETAPSEIIYFKAYRSRNGGHFLEVSGRNYYKRELIPRVGKICARSV